MGIVTAGHVITVQAQLSPLIRETLGCVAGDRLIDDNRHFGVFVKWDFEFSQIWLRRLVCESKQPDFVNGW